MIMIELFFLIHYNNLLLDDIVFSRQGNMDMMHICCLFNSRNMLANLEGLCLRVEVFQKCLPN